MIDKDKDKAVLSHARLMMDIQQPSFEECWIEGCQAAQSDQEEENNPYTAVGAEHEQWLDGWWAGFYGEEALYQLALEKDFDNVTQADKVRAIKKAVALSKQPQIPLAQAAKVTHTQASQSTSKQLTQLPGYFVNLVKIVSAVSATFLISYGLFDFLA